ncbi:ubiquitin-specific protease otu1 [Tulasnella sp. 403]|nr:ubiquitin-specific protease otu1 [Tulasnella sp. 403]
MQVPCIASRLPCFTEESPRNVSDKVGYPPRALEVVPELPVSSLGIQNGDQLLVSASVSTQTPPTASAATSRSTPRTPNVSAPAFEPRVPPRQEQPSADQVDLPEGTLVHRVVPDDNSCLFSSIGLIFEQDMNSAPRLRQVVVDAIRKDPDTYSDVFLGTHANPLVFFYSRMLSSDVLAMSTSKPYPNRLHGELSIFSKHYQAEIASFDVETGRCDRFGEGEYDNRHPCVNAATKRPSTPGFFALACVASQLTGIALAPPADYDAVSLSPIPNAPLDFHQTLFPVSAEAIFNGAATLAGKLRAKKAYTNTATFDLKCQASNVDDLICCCDSDSNLVYQRCGKGLKGEKEAREHAKETGHAEFGEY